LANKEFIDEEWVMKRRNLNHGLSSIKTVLNKFRDPQDCIRCIHVAGTNGKGSTCNYLKDILVSQGYKVGMFTSPHLITHRDRIRINDEWISKDMFQKYLLEMREDIEEYQLGMFEIDTCIAFRWFCDEQVDYAIIETGLGGRLDSTNIIKDPTLCIITSIGFDHMNLLGNRIEQIANEKAGIIQENSRCLIGNIDLKAKMVICKHGFRKHAHMISLPSYYDIENQRFRFEKECYEINCQAKYQIHNASLALKAAELLGIDIKTEIVKEALKNSFWLGRFEEVCKEPRVIIDGAHNEEGIRALCESMQELQRPIYCVFSALKDKEVHKMAMMLKKNCDELIVTQFENERADTIDDLYVEGAIMEKDYQLAIENTMKKCRVGTIVITGSLYFISIVREYYKYLMKSTNNTLKN
jgi:dihydrofolate synthase / folylpolyglutamate synthase